MKELQTCIEQEAEWAKMSTKERCEYMAKQEANIIILKSELERLTFRHDAPYSDYHGKADCCEPINTIDKYSQKSLEQILSLLADYEDTGLIPTEIKALINNT